MANTGDTPGRRRLQPPATAAIAIAVLMAGCGESVDERDVRALREMIVEPRDLPSPCRLAWHSPPYPMSAWDDSRDLLETILGFWFEPGTIAPEALNLAVSNVYSNPDSPEFDDPLVIVSFAFRSKATALGAEERLSARFAATGVHYLGRSDRIVVVGARRPGLSEACADAAWELSMQRLESAL